ncbi:MAG: Nif3-like dinuclear metal center hexameric protein [Bacteroidota bacterium]
MTLTTLLISLILISSGSPHVPGYDQKMTAGEVIDQMKAHVTCDWSKETVDTFKTGDPGDVVTGIACTFTATMDVLKEAAARGCNLIITHEPTFYNHLDSYENLENDPAYQAKQAFIREHNMIIFRFHDHWHRTSPDGIYVGMINKLQWEPYLVDGTHNVFDLPQSTLKEVEETLEGIFPDANLRVIGDPNLVIDKTEFLAGAPGSITHISALQKSDVNLIVIGEAREWETIEYVRDASQAGMPKAVIILGHAVSEEAGMDYCAAWMRSFIEGIPIHFIPAGDPFQ